MVDIQVLLKPITDKFFSAEEGFNLQTIYNEVFSMEKSQVEALKQDMIQKYETSEKTFEDAPEDSRDFLKLFSFICELSFDVYVKKLLIEKLIDHLAQTPFPDQTRESKKESKNKEKK